MLKQTRVLAPRLPAFLVRFIDQIPNRFEKEGKIIYNRRNQIRVFNVSGQQINVKKFAISSIFNRFLYSFGIRTPKVKSAYKNALKIIRRGIDTPRPLGFILERKHFLIQHSYLITQQIQNQRIIPRTNPNITLVKSVARYTALLHKKGLLHCDYTPNNILFCRQHNAYHFTLVDVNQFRFYRKEVPLSQALPYLINLFIDEENLTLFISEYATQRQADVKKCVQAALLLRQGRTTYSLFKKGLKKLPFARFFQTKRLDKKISP